MGQTAAQPQGSTIRSTEGAQVGRAAVRTQAQRRHGAGHQSAPALCLTTALSAPHSPRSTLALSTFSFLTSFTRLTSPFPSKASRNESSSEWCLHNTFILAAETWHKLVHHGVIKTASRPGERELNLSVAEEILTSQSFKIGQRHVTVPTIPAIIAGVVTLFLVYTLSTPSSPVSVDSFTPHLATPTEIPVTYYSKPGMSYLELTSNPLYGLPRTKSKFLVEPEQFPPTPLKKHLPDDFKVPDYVPKPVGVKVPGMRVPNAIHYVYGLKPPKHGYSGEQLPYYAYLAMKSAITRLKPEKTFL